jgi:septal ring-binding cell division protein DamX
MHLTAEGLLRGVRMAGHRHAHGSRFRTGTWIICGCMSLGGISSSLSAQTRSMTPPPAAAPASPAPMVCAAPSPATSAAATHTAPSRVIASGGDVAGRSGTKPATNATTKPSTKPSTNLSTNPSGKLGTTAHQWTVQVASFETLADAQSMQQSLCGHGYEARVVGVARPYVVRVGRFPTSKDALAAARHLTTPKLTVFVTQAEH